jgi:uncharacterized protein (DUF2252 family)
MTASTQIRPLSVEERSELGEQARNRLPLRSHAEWHPPDARPDPVDLLTQQNATREADLLPVRHGRMMVSPFTFYRGSARIMATDLASTPSANLEVQLCGDAHLSNFGGFASPERQLIFGLNDFDETLPGPFEYDVKRMSASFAIAAGHNGFTADDVTAMALASARAYREAMLEFAEMRTLDVWYANMSEAKINKTIDDLIGAVAGKSVKARHRRKHGRRSQAAAEADVARAAKAARKAMRKARTRNSQQVLPRLASLVGGKHRIVSRPPVLVPLRDLAHTYGMSPDQAFEEVDNQFRAYTETLNDNRRLLLGRFSITDVARKVVGVGSVGTRAWIVLLEGRDSNDPLFLQVKEATRSVLEDHLPPSRYDNPGERVVQGQRLLQAASDIFLGWTKGLQFDRYYYWRQLRDMKTSVVVEGMSPVGMAYYARLCGWTLARAHARSGDPIAIAEYLGRDTDFETAIAAFSNAYARQNQRDYEAFVDAIARGVIPAVQGV